MLVAALVVCHARCAMQDVPYRTECSVTFPLDRHNFAQWDDSSSDDHTRSNKIVQNALLRLSDAALDSGSDLEVLASTVLLLLATYLQEIIAATCVEYKLSRPCLISDGACA